MLNGISLFTGYAGIDLALKEYVRPITYCEIEKYAQGILLSRMEDESIPFAPLWNDVTTLDGKQFKGLVDIIYGGFPCQDISVAGKGVGLEGKRSGLFFEIIRIAREANPTFLFLENVPAIRTRGAFEVQRELASIGYDTRWTTLSASEVGANHKRERWFCLATNSKIKNDRFTISKKNNRQIQQPGNDSIKTNVANSMCERLEGQWESERVQKKLSSTDSICDIERETTNSDSSGLSSKRPGVETTGLAGNNLQADWWTIEPDVGRVANGVAFELDFIIFENEEFYVSCVERGDQKEVAEIDLANREVLRKMWEYKNIAETSPELYLRRLHDSLPGLPQGSTHSRSVLGKRISQDIELRCLWERFYTETESSEQALWQSILLERIWQIKCNEEMGKLNRVDRIKALGNGCIPLQAKTAFEILIGL